MGRWKVWGSTTFITSLTWGAAARAAALGNTSLPKVVEGASTWLYPDESFAIWGASTAAKGAWFSGRAMRSTCFTPLSLAAASHTALPSAANTAMSMSPPMASAQLTARAVLLLRLVPSCSAMTRILLMKELLYHGVL